MKYLAKSQMTALLATAVDYGSLLLFVEVFHLYYVIAVAIAAGLGAISNFIANRVWTYQSQGVVHHEIMRYSLVSLGSLLWNTLFVWLVTENIHTPYYISKIFVAILVGLIWNYPLQRFWVFHYES